MKISARGLQEFLAGRLSREEFKRFVADNLFERALSDGRTISNITIERKETEKDDDYLIFEFEDDLLQERSNRRSRGRLQVCSRRIG
ncbi:hypothetical protein [Rhizobium ruizarguesonis]|uniref:hypothetical protein n=1 Tax=Rhizobium ruizarguesonis TaxID=2081791 RepID=UPI00371539D3